MFPLPENKKPFPGSRGLTDATLDPGVIQDLFEKYDAVHIGVNTGKSGIIALDIDLKNGKDGFQSIENAWHTVPETFFYETPNYGEHHIFEAPDEKHYAPGTNYDGMSGVDRRSGGSYVVWYGDVPKREQFSVAPEWLCKSEPEKTLLEFDGDLDEWIMQLTPGDPSVLVRRAINRANELEDMSHSEMVSLQFNAVRLGAEGHSGVPELIGVLRQAWLNRPAENHTTPESEWRYKFDEALESAIHKYGRQIELLANLPEYDPNKIPTRASDLFFGSEEATNYEWTQGLRALIDSGLDDNDATSVLWNAPRTSPLSKEWGIEFVFERVQSSRDTPEPTSENPALETVAVTVETTGLLSDAERKMIEKRWTFADVYAHESGLLGFYQPKYSRASAWTCLSMGLGFKGFIPKSGTHKMGVNLWFVVPAESGTGKSVTNRTQYEVLNAILTDSNEDVHWNIGSDSSIQGQTLALLSRDNKASILMVDEAARFFKQLRSNDWMSGIDNTLAHWYEGRVDPSNKLNLKDMKGKSARTSYNIHMLATPDDLFKALDRDMFKTGFLARFNWVIGPPPPEGDFRFEITQVEEGEEVSYAGLSAEVSRLAVDIVDAGDKISEGSDEPQAVRMNEEARLRISAAYKTMYSHAKSRDNWDIIEPSITRLSETMQKLSVLNAMYRGNTVADIGDALNAISSVEEWYHDLFEAAARISDGDFQKNCEEVAKYVRSHKSVSHAKLYYTFRTMAIRSRRDIDDVIEFLKTSGQINVVHRQKSMYYEINGG